MPERERDERFHLNLEDIKDYAIFRVDPEGRIASWNAGAERLKGYTAREAIGQPFAMLFTPEDVQAHKPEEELRLAAETGLYEAEGVRMRKGGQRFDAHVILRSLSDQGGVHRGFIKVTQDITGRKSIEAELQERAEFEQQLIGIVSHDLRTPLAAITLATALLQRDSSLSPRHAATVARILTSAERAQRLIASLLDFTQARVGGGFVLQYAPLELHGFVELAVEDIRLLYPERELHLEHEGEGQGEWDPDRLAQLLTNLLNNALTHGLREAPVRVRVQGEADSVVLAIHNQGKPIPAAAVPHLFTPMRRGDGAHRTGQPGSIGLGLYIVQQIALAHGGTISVDSSQERGTTFTARLPRHPPPAR
ncbi:PAS domain-containing sensor histidine kinase [Archangium sp.]|uniref:PAS domain-containing sensor histidine kinase n=1 Tax=Archangium sp. TaxID=1872627 RepID=UPI00286A5FD4|nr:PAS domain-containing sensor histidine kinase [Archangium sp.]